MLLLRVCLSTMCAVRATARSSGNLVQFCERVAVVAAPNDIDALSDAEVGRRAIDERGSDTAAFPCVISQDCYLALTSADVEADRVIGEALESLQ